MATKNLASSIAKKAVLAAALEASTEKPGNVTPTKKFDDLSYNDFLEAAQSLEKHVKKAARAGENVFSGEIAVGEAGIGKAIYDATQKGKNINFGIVLMFVPLATAAGYNGTCLRDDLRYFLRNMTYKDTIWIYKAMRAARLGGMDTGVEKDLDVFSEDSFKKIEREKLSPVDVFKKVAQYDTLAKEWVTDYSLSFRYSEKIGPSFPSIKRTYLEILAEHPDTLIARKCGLETAQEVSKRAKKVLEDYSKSRMEEFDSYLRKDKNRLNPGTTADLVATALFIKLLA
ncbi:MAG: triphosphoribosyl-dephospho-CoA synthase [Candidatus Altiarchaeota archaeon]|nr:triphosphoribosyl-dephospho-CoA synthase [Candidatus Altiarchaeota archaeon]